MTSLPAPPPPAPRPGLAVGRLLFGLVVVALGVGWLLQVLDVTTFPWKVILPVALVLIGLALLVTARSVSGHAGLIALGIILTVVLAAGTLVDIPLEGGIGQRTARPATFDQLRDDYRLAIGQLTIDLTRLHAAGEAAAPTRKIHASVGLGQLVVVVPSDVPVTARGHAAVGEVSFFGHGNSGFDVRNSFAPRLPSDAIVFSFDVSVGVGQVVVRYG